MADFICEEYSSLTQYLDVIVDRKVNEVFKYRQGRNDLCSESEGYRYSLTNSYKESVELAKKGYKEGLNNLMQAGLRVTHRQNITKNMPSTDFVGYAPHVANAIAGIPKAMISTAQTEQRAKVVTILYSFANHAGVEASRWITAGKNLLNVINTLEAQGYRVGLYMLDSSCESESYAFNIVRVKHWRQPSNLLKISYPLLHPAYLRRNGLKWLETLPNLTDDRFSEGYGKPFHKVVHDYSDRVKLLRDKGVLKTNWFYVEFTDAEYKEADDLIKYMGIK